MATDPTKPKLCINVKCPWPWCPGKLSVSGDDLDLLLDMLCAWRRGHQACKPKFTYTITDSTEKGPLMATDPKTMPPTREEILSVWHLTYTGQPCAENPDKVHLAFGDAVARLVAERALAWNTKLKNYRMLDPRYTTTREDAEFDAIAEAWRAFAEGRE